MRWGLLTESMRFEWWTPYVRLGGTEAEAKENYRQLGKGYSAGGSGTPEEHAAWLKLTKPLRPKKRRPKPADAPLTKTELKRKAVRERARAKMEAWRAKNLPNKG